MENKNYGVWGGVIAGVIVIVLILMYLVKTPTPPTPGSLTLPPVTAADWQKGDSTSLKVSTSTPTLTLVEYSDFQCPACAVYYGLVKKIEAEYGTSTTFVYRHFPLSQHLDAKLASAAAEAAGKQGKFFEMHDLLFENQSKWGIDTHILPTDPKELTPAMRAVLEPKLLAYAQTLGLDIEKFKADMNSEEITKKIEEAFATGVKLGIPATPTFFLNGKQTDFPNYYDGFKKVIDDALQNS